ncbi:structural maintenance of chromosomes protein 6-like [Ptychodera flava]|uniref:structural maintenance of chromosomes protein 6-like n=1 Tax=Ptychodera flava TaxID=63121 RepID=UPI00396A5EEA
MTTRRHRSQTDENAPPTKRVRLQEPRRVEEWEEDEEGEESDEMDQSQNPDFVPPTMVEAEVGIIERVTLKNFMCHSRLEFNFGPNVNFIVGRNGSGKSAVLTAMVVGLGGKATVTNRGSSVKAFIKDGQNFAEVAIKLRNRGTDAYKPELYGDSIIVERRLTTDGSTQYKLKSSSGRLISRKREDLSYILDQYNIQVDNPVAILNQDTSRNFLHSKNPHDKYKFFLKATQLEQMTNDYSTIQEQKTLMKDTVKRREECLPDLEKEVFLLENRVKALGSLEKLKEKKEKLEHMAAWAQVAEIEKDLEPIAKAIRQEEARRPKFDKRVDESKEKLNVCSGQCKEIQEKLSLLGEKLKELKPKHAEARSGLESSKKACKSAQANLRKLHSHFRNTERDKQQLEEKIEEMKNTAQQDFEAERRQREDQIQRLENQQATLTAQLATTEQQLDQFAKAINHDKEQSYTLRRREQDLQGNIDNTQRRLKNLEASRENKVAVFGNWVPALLREIDKLYQQRRFRRKPVGPVGAHLSLTDQNWAIGVEACLKNLIHSYCCDNHEDENLLNKLLNDFVPRNRPRPSVITSQFMDSNYDIRDGAVQGSQYPSFLDIVKTDNPVIYNCLVDQRSVESVLLIEDSAEARSYLRRHPPRNCREAFTIAGDQVYAGAEQRYYSNFARNARYITADVEQQIRETEQELNGMKREQEGVQRQHTEINSSIRANTTQKNQMLTRRMKLHEQCSKVQFDINELKNYEEPTPVDVTTLEEEVKSYTDQMLEYQQQIEVSKTNLSELDNRYKEAEEIYKDVDQDVNDLAETVDPLKDELTKANMEEATAKDHVKHYEGKRKEHETKIGDLRKKHQLKEKEIAGTVEKATKIYPERMVVKRTAANIDSEIAQITLNIELEQQNYDDPGEVYRLYEESKKKYSNIKAEIKNFNAVVKKFNSILKEREKAYGMFLRLIAARSKIIFVRLLSSRKISGKLDFNHKEKLLKLSVQPTQGESTMAKDMKALSGGERSFSTVCFIMALWEAMDSPFRALDEFDVFMDMVNRRISVDMMLKVAKEQKMRQFIFLTPQDMSKITANPLVRISRMHDPERGQDHLRFNEQDDEDDDSA